MPALDTILANKLEQLEQKHLRRHLRATQREAGDVVWRAGKKLISFSCNDYLGLSHHPHVIARAKAALEKHGAGSGASRLVTGDSPLYRELEQKLATLKGTDAACVFGSGYLANMGTIPALVGDGDLVLIDRLAHACLLDGTRNSGASWKPFRHNDMAHLTSLLQQYRGKYRHCLIVTDGVFSMDGDIAPVAELSAVAKGNDAWLMTDDAHGIGIMGAGAGSSVLPDGTHCHVDVQMGTLSKAIGGYGGYVCGSYALVDYLKNTARSLVFSTGLPPVVLASALGSLEVLEREPEIINKPVEKARFFARELGLPVPVSPIVPLFFGEPENALKAAQMLVEKGFLVVAIRPPTVPKGTARLRFTFSATHRDEDILRMTDFIKSQGWLGGDIPPPTIDEYAC